MSSGVKVMLVSQGLCVVGNRSRVVICKEAGGVDAGFTNAVWEDRSWESRDEEEGNHLRS